MVLPSLMRIACHSTKVKPALSVALKFSSVPSVLGCKLPVSEVKNLQHKVTPQYSVSEAVRQFSTTNVKLSGHGDHSKLWTMERVLSAGLLGVVPVGLMYPSIVLDTIMAVSLVMHTHWGIEAIAVDYVRPILFGTFIPKVAIGMVYLLSVATLVGLLNLIFNGPGLANSISLLWKI